MQLQEYFLCSGVMAQVDEAMAKEEEERKKKQLEKEEMDIKYDVA